MGPALVVGEGEEFGLYGEVGLALGAEADGTGAGQPGAQVRRLASSLSSYHQLNGEESDNRS